MIPDELLRRIGIPVPDSAFSLAARELIATVAPPYLVNHSVRAYAWAVELARHDGLQLGGQRGARLSGGGTKAGGADYLRHFLDPRVVTENTMRRGFAPEEE